MTGIFDEQLMERIQTLAGDLWAIEDLEYRLTFVNVLNTYVQELLAAEA